MEADDDGDGHDGHVDGEAQPGQEGALVGAVVARVRRRVVEEQHAEEWSREEDVPIVRFIVSGFGIRC